MTISDESTIRTELAACFRIAVEEGWHESVANHFSAAISDDGRRFVMNPRWRHFGLVRQSELLTLDAADDFDEVMARPDAPDLSAWCIHGAIHAAVPTARVLLHLHPPYATALACLADPTMYPIDQNTGQFFGEVAYDREFGGLGDSMAEGHRLAEVMADHRVMLMGNHGVMVAGQTVAEAFESMYYFERAAQTLMLAYASGQPLSILEDELAAKVVTSTKQFAGMGPAHLAQRMEMLDRLDPSYRD